MMLPFLDNWTIDLDELPTYDKFKKPFTVTFDKKISQLLVSGVNPKITNVMITNYKNNVMDYIDKNNKLTVTHKNPCGLGRFYGDGDRSPVCHSKFIKHTVFSYQKWLDIDMVKGHSSILLHIGKKNGLALPAFNDVVHNFDAKWREIAEYYKKKCNVDLDEDNIKYYFNMTIYGGGYDRWLKKLADEKDAEKYGYAIKIIPENIATHPFMEMFKRECVKISALVYANNPDLVARVAAAKETEYEKQCCTISYFCGIIENHIVYFVYNYLVKNGGILPNQCLPELDGICMPRLEGVDYDQLIIDINAFLLPIENKFKIKAYGKFVLPDIIEQRIEMDEVTDDETVSVDDVSNDIYEEELSPFEKMAKEFEKCHIKITNKQMFLKETDDGFIFMKEAGLKVAYAHLCVEERVVKAKKETMKSTSFIKKWISHEHPNIRRAEDVGVFPNEKSCPKNIYNIWQPFAAEKFIGDYKKNEEALHFILNHILLLCGKQQDAYDYFILWIAHMIQYPEQKSKMVSFISKQGSGKGTLIRLLSKMLGDKRVFQSSNPSRDVWGNFNSLMAAAYLVNLDELSKMDTKESEGRIKNLVTEPNITINGKGQEPYNIASYHRFLITTNSEDNINTETGDRRNLIMRCSDDKKGDAEYFKQFYAYLDDETVIRTCYDYFKDIKGAELFANLPIPETEFQNNLKEKNKPITEQWLEDFVRRNCDDGDKELLGNEIYKDFTKWTDTNGIRYDTNSIKLGLFLSNCGIDGVSKGRHTKFGDTRLFDIGKLKKYYNIGCLVEI